MDYKKLYERQYGKKRIVDNPQRQFLGLRKFLKKYDWNRYFVTATC